MTKRIHNAILTASLISFLCCVLVILGVSYPYFNATLQSEVSREAQYLCAGTEIGGREYLESFQEKRRITLIDTDGSVIYDTVDDTYDLENHKDREEVKEAFETGEGESYRYSATLTEKTYYYARRLSNGTVLRVSVDQMTLGAVILRMLIPMAIAFIVVTVVSAILSSSLAKKIVKPINELDFSNPTIGEGYEELTPLLRKISRQNSLIDLQMKDLKKRQEEFLTITGDMSEGLILIDAAAQILSYNKSALKLFGVKKTDLGDSVLTFSNDSTFQSTVEKALLGEKCQPVFPINGKSLQMFANPVEVEESISGAVLLILDVTEKEERDSMRREFTSNVSHELKTPLTSIYGISEIMMNGIVRPEDMTQFAENIHSESGRLITLVNDIIKLSQLDENAPALEREELDLLAAAKVVRTRLEKIAEERNITITVTGEKTTVFGIHTIISEMIYNLCDNAIKYNRDGGKVEISVFLKDSRPAFSVKDTGIGIPKEHTDRIFERFYRVDKSHSRSMGGTGLGLSIVKHGAAVHNAELHLKSVEGEGTTVTIVFEK
ncbi:MAG: PAS domain-containing protein [Clostridia bacterium]|nr:PAS domain-containing protein [Clostridia bacterium]